MRPVERIPKICKKLEELWLKNPDYRFGQLLINYGIAKDNIGTWATEDTDWEKHLDKHIK